MPIVAGTLGEEMCTSASRFADAIMTRLAPASYLASVVLPAARRGADATGIARPADEQGWTEEMLAAVVAWGDGAISR